MKCTCEELEQKITDLLVNEEASYTEAEKAIFYFVNLLNRKKSDMLNGVPFSAAAEKMKRKDA